MRSVFEAVNAERRRQGLEELVWHEEAARVAEAHSRELAESGRFSHGDLEGRLQAAGIRWSAVAENLYRQRGCPDPVRCAVQGWLESAGHRRNILNRRYTHTGLGVHAAPDGTVYYTQVFLVPRE